MSKRLLRHVSRALLCTTCALAGRAQAVPPVAATKPAGDEPVTLSVFEVTGEKDIGYAATSALTGTRTNEKLENLPNSISVMTQDFIQDLAFNNYLDAVGFGMSTENIANDNGTVGAIIGQRSGNQVNIRGLATIRQLRDGFPWYLNVDTFNTERIEFGRGPGGLAYGDVDAGGIINIGSKRANFRRAYSAQVRYDNFGTRRYSVDLNQPVIPNRLSARFNAIHSEVEQWHQRQGRDLEGYAGSLRWLPFQHKRTQVDVAYETGNTTYHLSHLGPTDSRSAYVRGTGTTALDANPNLAGVQTNGVGMKQIQVVGNTHAFVDIGGTLYNLQSTAANVYRFSNVIETTAATLATDPQNPERFPLVRVPESIVPMREDWAGPDNKQHSKYYAYTVELKHTFSDRFSALIAHNGQFDETLRTQVFSSLSSVGGLPSRSVFVDVNPELPNPNGTGTIRNPRYEKYFITFSPLYNPDGHDILNWRGLLVYDAKPGWGITQRIVVGANYRHEKNYQDNFGYALTREEMARRGFTGAAAYFTNNLVYPIHYLADGNGDQTLGFSPDTKGVAAYFRQNAGQGVNRRLDQSLTSGFANVLGTYFGGKLHTNIGFSREHWLQSASRPTRADTAANNEQRFVDENNVTIANFGIGKLDDIPLFRFADKWSSNQTYGAVWHALPWVSFTAGYFESSQFSDNYGLDLNGNALSPLTGEGSDYSVRFHPFGEKVHLAATYYETKQENVTANVSGTVQTELNALLDQPLANLVDYRDRTSTGWEYQLTTNITRNWTLDAKYSRGSVEFTRFFPLLQAKIVEAQANAKARGLVPEDATIFSRQFLEDQEGNAGTQKRASGSVATRYTFTQGTLKGFSAGVAARYQRGKPWANLVISGVEVLPARESESIWITSPFFAYRRKIGPTNWVFQLNINNVFDVRTDQGNSWRWPRLTEPRQFVWTSTVTF